MGHTAASWVRLLSPFRWLAAVGFLLSLAVHVVSIAGIALPNRAPVFALHVGVFVVWVPVVIATIRIPRGSNRRESFENALSGAPAWMSHGLQLLFLYALLNFALFALNAPEHPARASTPPSLVRGFSGHWLLFYAASFAVLYSVKRRPELSEKRDRDLPR